MNSPHRSGSDLDPLLRGPLRKVALRRQRLNFWCKLAAGWAGSALFGALLLWIERQSGWASALALPLVALLGITVAVVLTIKHGKSPTDWRQVANSIEATHPELDGCLLTAVQQQAKPGTDLNYLQQRLLQQALSHSHRRNWAALVPSSRIALAQTAHWAALVLFLLVLWGLRTTGGDRLLARIPDSGIRITPGDTSLERGQSLVVLAHFGSALPPGVDLVVSQAPDALRRIPLVKSLADPVFGGSVPDVTSNITYHLEYSGRRSPEYKVSVFDFPRLERADAGLIFPEYTGLEPKRIEDTRRISAVEGSTLNLDLKFNKAVTAARLISRDDRTKGLPLLVQSNNPTAALTDFSLQASGTYDLQLIDSDGRTNKVPAQFVFNVLKNNGPELRLASPRGDVRPSPLEEIFFEGTVWDEFGVPAYGLAYTVAGEETKFIELGGGVPAKEKRTFKHVLRLEDLGVQPDQLVAWFAWADDTDVDGQIRRSSGDMFFAEVRPFDEIFREGQGMEGGQSQQSGQQSSRTSKLAEMQREILNATWRLQRDHGKRKAPPGQSTPVSPSKPLKSSQRPHRNEPVAHFASFERASESPPAVRLAFFGQRSSEPSAPPTQAPRKSSSALSRDRGAKGKPASYQEDITVVRDAQAQALEQVENNLSMQDDPRIAELWKTAAKDMEKALALLTAASNSPALLAEAIAAEQAASQALLKLQQHEYQVMRNRQRNQSGGGGAREQQMQLQLEQMDLTESENRYETQRQAQPQQSAERRDDLQVMNRLQELARRQQDLNERLKELQAALQEARTEEEREEIRRRLKRLQEEEQQMLADVDELRQRMERPENQSRMADERKQLEETREDVQRAAEAAAEGSASQALAAGTRAQRQLQQMRDQMRKEASSQFSEDLRQMRSEARELAREQEEILNRMDSQDAGQPTKRLSDEPKRDGILDQLTRQTQRLTNLVDRATQVSQEAEAAEPLLSRQLYDTLRKFSQDNSKSIKQTQEELLERGLLTPSLYERLKATSENDASKLMDLTTEMVRQDFAPQARQTADRARTGIESLKLGVEGAAESVLGDDTEALRLAQQQLDETMDQLEKEMAQAGGSGTNRQGAIGSGANPRQTNSVAQAGGQSQPGSTNNASDAQPGQLAQAEGAEPNASGTASNNVAGETPQDGQRGDRDPSGRQSRSSNQATAESNQQSAESSRDGDPQTAQSGQGRGGRDPNTNTPTDADAQPRDANQPGDRETPSSEVARSDRRSRSSGGANDSEGGREAFPRDWQRLLNETIAPRSGPITGDEFGPWSDRLREVEELVDLPELRNEVASARERARLLRQDYKRDGKKPDWAVVQLQVIKPLVEVRDRVAEELARRGSREALVPIDRDPVPARYSDLVRKYYEELGKDK